MQTKFVDRLGLGDTGPDLATHRLSDHVVGYSSLAYAFSADGHVTSMRGQIGMTHVPIERFELPERFGPEQSPTTKEETACV